MTTRKRIAHFRSGFTLVELLIVFIVIAILFSMSIPLYRHLQIRTDLEVVTEQTRQALRRAQALSQSGNGDSTWGYSTENGVLYKGGDYDTRNPAFDEFYPIPTTVSISGLSDIVFSRVYGEPNVEGDIVITSLLGDQRTVAVRGTLGAPPPPPIPPKRFKIIFDVIENLGKGSAQNTIHVGYPATIYGEGEWIDLTDNGDVIIDDEIEVGALGLAVQRQQGYFKILAYGGLDSGGKEVVDARIILEDGIIEHVFNDADTFETENPFDGNVNNGVGGDEVTIASNSGSVYFQTRTTNYGDGILIYWSE